MPSVILYAELLSNIRQISVVAELPTPQDSTTQVYLSPSRELLIIRHEGCATALRLPGEISATYVPKLPPPQPNVRQISWRIPLAPQPTQSRAAFPESSTAPWTSGDLTFSSSFACRKCYAVVIAPNTIKTWQDLPSANWAEMMDFWHCHKPDVPKAANNGANAADGGKENVEQKGYGANSSFNADKGVGKVDLTSFLIHEDDCSVKLLSPSEDASSRSQPSLVCSNCAAVIGRYEPSTSDRRLTKWALKLLPSSAPPLTHFVIPYLTSLTAALAVSKFLIHSPSPSAPHIFTWLFAPSLTISFGTILPGHHPPPDAPTSAAKLFYKFVEKEEAERLKDSPDASVEEVELDANSVEELGRVLEKSTKELPESGRKFGEWGVGLLEFR